MCTLFSIDPFDRICAARQSGNSNDMERVFIAMMSVVTLAVVMAILAPNPAAAINCENNGSHNIIMGRRCCGDSLIFMDQSKKRGKFLRAVSADVDSGFLPKRITYIEVIDGYSNDEGGCAYLKNGGVGNHNAAFHLKSQIGRGWDFTIRVYGH